MEEQAKYNKNTTMGEMEEYKNIILCELSKPKPSPLDRQVGGDHYKTMKIQPVTFIMENNLSFAVGNIIKYVCRHDKKNGIEDIQKARQYLDFLEDKWNKDNENGK